MSGPKPPFAQPRSSLLLLLLPAVLAAAPAQDGASAQARDPELVGIFDRAEEAAAGIDARQALDLYGEVARRDGGDPGLRNRAAIRGAFVAWHVFQDADQARALLAGVPSQAAEASQSWSERARLELELTGDLAAARDAAHRALELARTLEQREAAVIQGARATLEGLKAKAQREAPTEDDRKALKTVSDDLLAAIEAGGPVLEVARLLLNAALLAGDRTTALQAWRWYYSDVPGIVPASEVLADPHELGLALAAARLFPEAELVLRSPFAGDCAKDPSVRDVLTYAAALRRVEALARDHHRATAQGRGDDAAFEAAFGAESVRLWNELSWAGSPPEFSPGEFQREVLRRFGAVGSFGRTDGVLTLLLGHAVVDESRLVEQHGHEATLRFVLLDGMVAGGYVAWVTGDRTGTGGWIGSDAIYQIRPMYADGPVRLWRKLTDPQLRADLDEELAAQARLDIERAQRTPLGPFPGLALRLELQTSEAILGELKARGVTGTDLQLAFLQRVRQNEFEASIWAHEGRHAIDKSAFGIQDGVELEYRAKTSEVVLAPLPRGALGSILSPVGGPGAHGAANARLLAGVEAWMKEHAEEIAGLDADSPLGPQLDRLSDAQLRAAFASLDPQKD